MGQSHSSVTESLLTASPLLREDPAAHLQLSAVLVFVLDSSDAAVLLQETVYGAFYEPDTRGQKWTVRSALFI